MNKIILSSDKNIEFKEFEGEDEKKLSDKIYQLWKSLLDEFDNKEWFIGMHDDLIAMNPSYNKISEL